MGRVDEDVAGDVGDSGGGDGRPVRVCVDSWLWPLRFCCACWVQVTVSTVPKLIRMFLSVP